MRQDIYCDRNHEKREERVNVFFHFEVGGVFIHLFKSQNLRGVFNNGW